MTPKYSNNFKHKKLSAMYMATCNILNTVK